MEQTPKRMLMRSTDAHALWRGQEEGRMLRSADAHALWRGQEEAQIFHTAREAQNKQLLENRAAP